MTLFHDTFPTPFGPFSIAVDEKGALVASAFGDAAALRQRIPASLAASEMKADRKRTAAARTQIRSYAAGETKRFDVTLHAAGTTFQERVWRELTRIPFGTTTTYGALAAKLGSSPRAVGRANATNPVCLVVPCHRVVGADGSLTGFAFGEDVKRRLLEHEGVALAAAVPA